MTAILRIVNVIVSDSSNILVTFTETLTPNLVPANVSILSQTANVVDSAPLQVTVSGANLSIICQPMTAYAAYFLQFQSVDNSPFISVNGDAKISQDGVSNRQLITGPLPADNPVMDYLQSFYQNNIYRADDSTTVVNQYLQSIAVNFAKALYENPKAAAFISGMTCLKRLGEPEDIAGAAVFLASDAARYITGQFILVDGGASVFNPIG